MEPLFVVQTGGSVMSMWNIWGAVGGAVDKAGGVADGTGQQISKC